MKIEDAVAAETPERREGLTDEGKDGARTITSVSESIRTLDDALAAAKVDTAIWEVERFIVNKWEVGSKIKTGRYKQHVELTPLWQVKVWLRRRIEKKVEDAFELLLERAKKHYPKYPAFKPVKIIDPHLLEIAIFDPHFGKLAWGKETGANQDLKSIEKIYHNAVTELITMAKGFPIEKILFPLGQDFFHIDNAQNTTVNGTPLDVDSRYPKIFSVGVMACVRAIDHLMEIAPVDIIWVPGNHDRTTSYHLLRELAAWYKSTSRVNVNVDPSPRKYYHYGKTLIGYTHGNEERLTLLPSLMADEMPKEWAQSSYREWHIGHWHRKAKFTFGNSEDSIGSVTVRVIPSLSGPDAWHHRKGFVKGKRAAEAYLWGRDSGYVGHFQSSIRE